MEEPRAQLEPLGQYAAGVAEHAVLDQPPAQLLFWVRLVSEAPAAPICGAPRQQRARLDQDELRAHRHESAEQRQPAALDARQRVEIGAGKIAQADREDVELALLDE